MKFTESPAVQDNLAFLKAIAKDNGVLVLPKAAMDEIFDEPRYEKNEGYAIMLNGKQAICVQDNMPEWQETLAFAHELAHCIFGHLHNANSSEQNEREASMFSCCLTALMIYDQYRNAK